MSLLENVKVGDTIAIRTYAKPWDGSPAVGLELHEVIKVTPTQFRTIYGVYRKKDGMELGSGGDAKYAFVPTKADLDKHAKEIENRKRWLHAATKLKDLIGKPLHVLGLNTAQLETLAEAWGKIKAMKDSA